MSTDKGDPLDGVSALFAIAIGCPFVAAVLGYSWAIFKWAGNIE